MQVDIAAGRMQRLQVYKLDVPGEQTSLATDFGMVHLKDRTPTTASLILMDLVRAEAAKMFAPTPN